MQKFKLLLLFLLLVWTPSVFGFEIHKDFISASEKPYRLSLEFQQIPKVLVESVIQLRLIDVSTGKLVDFRRIQFQADMEGEGMEHLPVPVDVEFVSPGHYQIRNVYFLMAGHWEIRVRLDLFDGSFQRLSLPLEFDPHSGNCTNHPWP